MKECVALVQAGFDVNYVVPGATSTTVQNVKIHGINKIEGSRFDRMTKTVKAVYRKALEIDAQVYHFHDPELIPVGLKLKNKGKRVIYDVHEDVPRQILNKSWLPFKSQKLISKLFEAYENRASKKFDLVVTATPFIRDRFLRLGANTIDVNNFPILDELKMEAVDWKSKQNAVCYVGGITKFRGIEEMVQAMGMTKDLTLLLAGTFTSNAERETVSKMNGWDTVHELGFLDRTGVREVYRQSIAGLVVLHPRINYIDALPVKMFEYMAAGIPVIASNFPLWKSIIETNDCGICVNPEQPEAIAEAINYLYDNPDVAERMGRNGRKAVESEYNWEQESRKLIEAYKIL
ncbi:glycosyltransferase family 4 protein [Sporosarcina sp. 179-K 8C2 HS]|uniref:glycosyltransferase family 4 protein n=1 Tax=Sporosarcina sp. 179-K 8C2 HS TaxID=3142387 RepID=UPI0039A0037B